jgi:hypothetical protein
MGPAFLRDGERRRRALDGMSLIGSLVIPDGRRVVDRESGDAVESD